MNIAVYAISKNESKFVDAWVDSMSEADSIYVLDTGSEDDTVERFRTRGYSADPALAFRHRPKSGPGNGASRRGHLRLHGY